VQSRPLSAVLPTMHAEAPGSEPPPSAPAEPSLDVVYAECADYVWRMLQRLGVRRADLQDVCHDVFLIAHRRFAEFDGRLKANPWLFGICLRVAANYRRRARFRYEQAGSEHDGDAAAVRASPAERPDHQVARLEAQRHAQTILDGMDPAKRAVFVMFELEGLSCQVIADQLGVPVGTVYSRLHAARSIFEREAKRLAITPGGES
jgi:RNA polymerase sigma-70 factor (ECF subfamily)